MFLRINNPNDRAIGRGIFALERKACFLAAAPEDQLTDAGAGSIYGDQGFTLRREIFVKGLDDQQLTSFQGRIFHRCDDSADYAGELHC